MTAEFTLIDDLIARRTGAQRADVALGIGDDCALLVPPPGRQLAVSLDLLVAGVHFLPDAEPVALGHKALAVNLSDLAASGAEPAWITLGLTLPGADAGWLAAFMDGFAALAAEHGAQLVGGDTTRGPLCIAVQVHGFVPPGAALTRSGARAGDLVCITGTPGEAAAGLALRFGRLELPEPFATHCLARLDRPTPRIRAGLALRGLASACIDVSDGLAQDLGHILSASGCGATLALGQLPLTAVSAALGAEVAWPYALAGGDDYELLFTLPAAQQAEAEARLAAAGCPFSVIGRIDPEPGLRLVRPDGRPHALERGGYEHFA